jgi:hypothetical protein
LIILLKVILECVTGDQDFFVDDGKLVVHDELLPLGSHEGPGRSEATNLAARHALAVVIAQKSNLKMFCLRNKKFFLYQKSNFLNIRSLQLIQ